MKRTSRCLAEVLGWGGALFGLVALAETFPICAVWGGLAWFFGLILYYEGSLWRSQG